ncbi:amidohydrolase family protein [Haloplanus pelagicus]|uniref:amidohydrolase family protein n=1 Tax=Haloplanus pelagicus TaxID=2949995 RepID=UPI00203C5517|nr:amidohydrolase family protein [Haloplanus sp. HW8-1]
MHSSDPDGDESELTIVDTDVHVNYVHPDMQRAVAQRLPEPYRTRLDPDTAQGFRFAYPGHHWVGETPGKDSAHTMPVTEPDAHVQQPVCEELGVDYPILNTAPSFVDHLPRERARAEMKAANDVLLDRFLDEYDHFYGLCTVATTEPDKAAEELDRMGSERQIVGAFIESGGPDKPLGNPRYDVLYQAAQDNDLPIVTHGFSGAAVQWDFPTLVRDLENWLAVRTLSHPFSQMLHLTSMIYQGVPEKFPDLNFVFLEAGIGWIPYMIGRLNRGYKQRRDWAPLLERTPEEYLRESFYIGTQPIGEPNDRRHMHQLLQMVGPEMLMFSTDHPHYDFDSPSALVDRYLAPFSRAEQDRILAGNAREVFGVPR